jgi:putative ABC transport system ATP-binding protein
MADFDFSSAAADGPIVEARAVTKEYDTGRLRVAALRGVDLTIGRGEVVAVMGPSGCGKTTLLNCLSGLDSVTSGSVTIAGRDLTTLSDCQLTDFRARQMGFVFQAYNLLPVLTAVEDAELPLLVNGVRAKDARRRALAGLEQVGLAGWSRHRPAELSGGQRQRVAIARALVTRPALIWADEPTGALDSHASQEIIDLMLRLNEELRLTFIWVTHAREVADQARRLITMRDGLIATDADLVPASAGPAGPIKNQPNLGGSGPGQLRAW